MMSDLDRDRERRTEPEDRLAALLRSTGRRPAVPADRAHRVRTAVRAHWQAEVGRRSRHRWIYWAAALATAATGAALVGLHLWEDTGSGTEARVVAVVEAVPAETGAAWRAGDAIGPGAVLATPEDARLAIRMAAGHSVRLDASTRVSLLSERALALDAGAVYVDSAGPLGPARGSIEVRTPLGDVHERGTQFEARLHAHGLRVRVREGEVLLRRADEQRAVSAGQELEVAGDGRATLRDAPASGTDWLWVGEVTPMMAIDGRPLREFLEWMARERGLRLEFASPALATSAAEIVLNGSIEGMTLDEALASVLPACRVRHRIERDVLLVEPLPAPAEGS